MPSPFPGMNPFLEQVDVWHDFHQSFVLLAREQLVRQIRPKYMGVVAEHRFFRENSEDDIDAFLEIRDIPSRELITVVELLSPPTKRPGPGREQYLARRRHLLASGVNLVEIDLLRAFPRLPLDEIPGCDYCVMISRPKLRSRVVLPIPLFDPLPLMSIPLRSGDPDAMLDGKAVIDTAYDSAGYEDYLYKEQPEPPLNPSDLDRARSFIPTDPV